MGETATRRAMRIKAKKRSIVRRESRLFKKEQEEHVVDLSHTIRIAKWDLTSIHKEIQKLVDVDTLHRHPHQLTWGQDAPIAFVWTEFNVDQYAISHGNAQIYLYHQLRSTKWGGWGESDSLQKIRQHDIWSEVYKIYPSWLR